MLYHQEYETMMSAHDAMLNTIKPTHSWIFQ